MADLRDLAGAAQALARRAERDPLRYFRPIAAQLAWLQDSSQYKLLRGPTQGGKTTGQCIEMIGRCTGRHPYLETRPPPIEAWMICHSREQSVAVQSKFYELCPKDELHPDTVFIPGRGFKGHTPVVVFKNGSVVRFKTTGQGSLGLASATIHYVGIDEPPPPEIWGELTGRVMRSYEPDRPGFSGVIGLSLTPIGRSCAWLKDLVEQGVVSDHRFSLSVEACTTIDGVPLITQEHVDKIKRAYLPIEVPQRIHGEWEGIVADRIFAGFKTEHIAEDFPRENGTHIAIGIDHGSIEGAQVAVLVAVHRSGEHPRVWVLDETISDGATTPEQDAHAILLMLRRNNMTYQHVDYWVGDRKHGGRRWGGSKSNRMLGEAFARALGMPVGRLPFRIRTARKPRGSVYVGVRQLHEVMLRDNFVIHPRCKQTIDSLMHWQGRDDDYKHALDALRYAAVETLTTSLYMPSHVPLYS